MSIPFGPALHDVVATIRGLGDEELRILRDFVNGVARVRLGDGDDDPSEVPEFRGEELDSDGLAVLLKDTQRKEARARFANCKRPFCPKPVFEDGHWKCGCDDFPRPMSHDPDRLAGLNEGILDSHTERIDSLDHALTGVLDSLDKKAEAIATVIKRVNELADELRAAQNEDRGA